MTAKPAPFVITKSPRVFEVDGIVANLEPVVAPDGYQQVKCTMSDGTYILLPHPDNYSYPVDIAPGTHLAARSEVVLNSDGTKTKKYSFESDIAEDEGTELPM